MIEGRYNSQVTTFTRAYLLVNGQVLTVTIDKLAQRVIFVAGEGEPFSLHIRQGYHLARFLFGIKPSPGDEKVQLQIHHLATFLFDDEAEEISSACSEFDDTKPLRRPASDRLPKSEEEDPI